MRLEGRAPALLHSNFAFQVSKKVGLGSAENLTSRLQNICFLPAWASSGQTLLSPKGF